MEKTKKIKGYLGDLYGFIEDIFGKYSEKIIINQKKEKLKLWLSEVYGYGNRVYYLFPKELDDESLQKRLNTLFSYNYSQELLENQKNKSLFVKK